MRVARGRSESDLYHVVSRGAGRQLIFEDDDDRLAFLRLLAESLANEGCVLHAWCLMGNHVHLLVGGSLERIAKLMRSVCGRYAQRFNLKHGRVGHLFQERYKSEPINDDAYFLTVLRYIHRNPEKAGIASCESYGWSSYPEYASAGARLSSGGLCDTSLALRMLGGQDEFARFHRSSDEENCLDVDRLRSGTRSMPDDMAAEIAVRVLCPIEVGSMKSMEKDARDAALRKLKAAGLSLRQIERLTGIGRGVIYRA